MCVCAGGARPHFFTGSLRPCKSRGEHVCPAPRLTQILHKHQLCTGNKAQGRSPGRATQCTLPSHLTPAPKCPSCDPHSQHFPTNAVLQQLLTQGGLSQEGLCLLGGPGPSYAILQKDFVLALLFQKLSVHISRREGTLSTAHTTSCTVSAFGFRPRRAVQAPRVSCPPDFSWHRPFLLREI